MFVLFVCRDRAWDRMTMGTTFGVPTEDVMLSETVAMLPDLEVQV